MDAVAMIKGMWQKRIEDQETSAESKANQESSGFGGELRFFHQEKRVNQPKLLTVTIGFHRAARDVPGFP